MRINGESVAKWDLLGYDQLVAVHHINDDLESEWHLEEYVRPAHEFFEAQLAMPAV